MCMQEALSLRQICLERHDQPIACMLCSQTPADVNECCAGCRGKLLSQADCGAGEPGSCTPPTANTAQQLRLRAAHSPASSAGFSRYAWHTASLTHSSAMLATTCAFTTVLHRASVDNRRPKTTSTLLKGPSHLQPVHVRADACASTCLQSKDLMPCQCEVSVPWIWNLE